MVAAVELLNVLRPAVAEGIIPCTTGVRGEWITAELMNLAPRSAE